MVKNLYIPDVLQYSDFDCGNACTQAILAYYGEDINEIKLLSKLKTRKTTGTGHSRIVDYFKKRGFRVENRGMDIDDLIKFNKKKIPVIVLAQAWKKTNVSYKKTNSFGHYIIFTGYDDENLYFEDPAIFGRGYIPRKEFINRWHAEDKKNEILIRYGIAVWGKKPYNYKKFIKIK
jgi:uncharacterized protein